MKIGGNCILSKGNDSYQALEQECGLKEHETVTR